MIDRSVLRVPAAGLIAAGVALPLLGHPGLACPLRTLTGVPCPLCGMSTSVQETVRGDIGDAIAASPVGIALVLVALAVLVGVKIDAKRIPGWSIGVALSGMWVFQLFRFSIL